MLINKSKKIKFHVYKIAWFIWDSFENNKSICSVNNALLYSILHKLSQRNKYMLIIHKLKSKNNSTNCKSMNYVSECNLIMLIQLLITDYLFI